MHLQKSGAIGMEHRWLGTVGSPKSRIDSLEVWFGGRRQTCMLGMASSSRHKTVLEIKMNISR
jgi:hypothetical protein